jgi:hypothetical protein
MTADLDLLRKREALLAERIANTDDPFLRDNLVADLNSVTARIRSLAESAA